MSLICADLGVEGGRSNRTTGNTEREKFCLSHETANEPGNVEYGAWQNKPRFLHSGVELREILAV
jgi:hypothetical protein